MCNYMVHNFIPRFLFQKNEYLNPLDSTTIHGCLKTTKDFTIERKINVTMLVRNHPFCFLPGHSTKAELIRRLIG